MTRFKDLREATKAVREVLHVKDGKAIRLRHVEHGGSNWEEVVFSCSSDILRILLFYDDGTVYGDFLDWDPCKMTKFR